MTCERCQHDIQVGDYPFCKGSPKDHIGGHYGVTGDDIPGGLEMKNLFPPNPDGSPKKFYSKSAVAQAAKALGYHNHVEHLGSKGSDKSKHTVRWI